MACPETQYRPINFQQNDSWAKKFSTGQTTYTGIYLEFVGQPDFRLIKKGERMQHHQDKQTYVNNQHDSKVRLLESRIRELEFAVQKLLKTVYGVEPKYKFVLMNEGEKE